MDDKTAFRFKDIYSVHFLEKYWNFLLERFFNEPTCSTELIVVNNRIIVGLLDCFLHTVYC